MTRENAGITPAAPALDTSRRNTVLTGMGAAFARQESPASRVYLKGHAKPFNTDELPGLGRVPVYLPALESLVVRKSVRIVPRAEQLLDKATIDRYHIIGNSLSRRSREKETWSLQMADHYRKDHPRGITPPNPDAGVDVVSHITKHRGMKTQFTSVSEDRDLIRHFSGALYATDSHDIIQDGHKFITHSDLIEHLRGIITSRKKKDRIIASRAFQMASRVKEAVIDWQFQSEMVERKHRITWCSNHIQRYFQKV
jgi:hypothetical protein